MPAPSQQQWLGRGKQGLVARLVVRHTARGDRGNLGITSTVRTAVIARATQALFRELCSALEQQPSEAL